MVERIERLGEIASVATLKPLSFRQTALAVSAASTKMEAILVAERRVKGSGWLPAPMGTATNPNAEDDAQPVAGSAE